MLPVIELWKFVFHFSLSNVYAVAYSSFVGIVMLATFIVDNVKQQSSVCVSFQSEKNHTAKSDAY